MANTNSGYISVGASVEDKVMPESVTFKICFEGSKRTKDECLAGYNADRARIAKALAPFGLDKELTCKRYSCYSRTTRKKNTVLGYSYYAHGSIETDLASVDHAAVWQALNTCGVRADMDVSFGINDLAGENFPTFVTTDDFAAIVKAVMSEVDKKIDDITRPISADAVKQLRDVLEACQPKLREANDLIGRLASDLGKSKARKTALRKDACIELGKRVRREQREAFEEIAALRAEYKSLEAEIRVKEAQNKRSKKEAVAQLMAELLTNVFGDRYVFDEADFTIRFKGEALGESADSVLSDGEKAALAFCFYIASTWELINEEDDKNKLFFVIDDPVSSMDFNYVYSIMQIIKGLQGAFGLNRARILLLTHNVAFFNMLMGEHLFSGAWMLDGGQVVKVKNELLAPYASHLRAISNVADGAMPDHTTGNSIRQVLETLMHFEDPSIKELGVYLNSDFGKDLREAACLQLICNDQSHGARTYGYVQPPMDVSLIRRGCSAVLRHIRERYPGQLVTAGIDVSESRPAS